MLAVQAYIYYIGQYSWVLKVFTILKLMLWSSSYISIMFHGPTGLQKRECMLDGRSDV